MDSHTLYQASNDRIVEATFKHHVFDMHIYELNPAGHPGDVAVYDWNGDTKAHTWSETPSIIDHAQPIADLHELFPGAAFDQKHPVFHHVDLDQCANNFLYSFVHLVNPDFF